MRRQVVVRRARRATMTLAMCGALATSLGAQPAKADRPVRDEAFKMIEAYLISNLEESLSLSSDQFSRAVPLVKQVQAERRNAAEERASRMRALRQLLASGTATEGTVSASLADLRRAEQDGPARLRKVMEALDATFTPLQQAKYRVLEADVEAKIRRLLTRGARENRGEGRLRPDRANEKN